MKKVLAVDDQAEVLQLLERLLQARGFSFLGCRRAGEALTELEKERRIDLVVLDLDLGPAEPDGIELLRQIKRLRPELPVVILTGKGSVQTAVEALRLGAADYIEKDPALGERLTLQVEKLDRLQQALEENRRLRRRLAWLEQRAGEVPELVGKEGGLRQVWEKIQALADLPRPVLVVGERGTGKELVAHWLHRLSRRASGPFVTINCAALSESLAEAELFGHERGAFTDATEGRPGKFELADGGTLFLDEVGNMPLSIQKKLLRVIEYQSFCRVRGNREIRVDVRVVAATNADLEREMAEGRFRSDLYDRLAFEVIRVPPLRQRREDIPALCRFFLRNFAAQVPGVQAREISPEALEKLMALEFPGNVRELKNLLERASYRARQEVLQPEDFDLERSVSRQGFVARVGEFEKQLLRQALTRGKALRQVAEELQLSYDQLRRLLKKHRLAVKEAKGR